MKPGVLKDNTFFLFNIYKEIHKTIITTSNLKKKN